MLRPMANLFAVGDPDPGFSRSASRSAWRRPGSSTASGDRYPDGSPPRRPFRESEPDGDAVRSRGFAFVEGRDRLERGRDLDWLDRVAELCDRSPHRLAELPGDFGFVRFRPDGTALAVRSCGGLVPLYLHRRDGGGVAIGTRLNYFPRLLTDPLPPRPAGQCELGSNPDDLHRRAHLRRRGLDPSRASHTELAPRPSAANRHLLGSAPDAGADPRPSPEHPRELRRILIETLSRDLDPEGRNLLMLSGGVDSSVPGCARGGHARPRPLLLVADPASGARSLSRALLHRSPRLALRYRARPQARAERWRTTAAGSRRLPGSPSRSFIPRFATCRVSAPSRRCAC